MNKSETNFLVADPHGGAYRPVSRSEIRKQLRDGALRDSRLIWNPWEETWKPACVFPDLKRTERLSVPAPPLASKHAKKDLTQTKTLRAIVKPSDGLTDSRISRLSPSQSRLAVHSLSEKQKTTSKWYLSLGVVMPLLISLGMISVVGLNWFGAHRPLVLAIEESSFRDLVELRGHYGQYIKPSTLVIEFFKLPQNMSSDQWIELLTMLASTVQKKRTFRDVQIVSQTNIKYVFKGEIWNALANKNALTVSQRKAFLADHLYFSNGKLALAQPSEDTSILEGQRDWIFSAFYEAFVH